MGAGWSRTKVAPEVASRPPIEIEGQLYIQQVPGHFSCFLDEGAQSNLPTCIRGRICYSGEAFLVSTLSSTDWTAYMCIPSSIEFIGPEDPDRRESSRDCTAIAFESSSQLQNCDPGSFTNTRIRSICVPASVTLFCDDGPWRHFPDSIEVFSFERGSQLRCLERPLFQPHVQVHLCFPASLEYINGEKFFWGRFRSHFVVPYAVEPGNRQFLVVGCCLMSFDRTSLIRSFGEESVATVDSSVEELGPRCFAEQAITDFTFPVNSRVRVIGSYAFAGCQLLRAITIPCTVEVIGECAFSNCPKLQEVRIESRSQLRLIEMEAFFCYSIFFQPVDVPRSTKIKGGFKVLAKVRDVDGSKWKRVQFQTRPVFRSRHLFGCFQA
jgi:hypothetical protein